MNEPRLPPKDQLIMGINAISEVLRHMPDRLIRVFTAISPSTHGRKNQLLLECEQKKIPVQVVSPVLLTKMAGSDSHQSFVAQIKGRHLYDVDEFLRGNEDAERLLVLMLSEIFDPQNFGAILRSAECFGASAVIWSKNRGSDLSPMVSKASCGASELLPLIRISNLADALTRFKEADFEIVAAVADPRAEPLSQFQYAPRTVLIVGSEGEGIQPLLQKKSDRFVFIPTQGKIESLNVAQATAVLLARWQ